MCHAICTYKIPAMKRSPGRSAIYTIHIQAHAHTIIYRALMECFAEALQEKRTEMKYVTKQKARVKLQNYKRIKRNNVRKKAKTP